MGNNGNGKSWQVRSGMKSLQMFAGDIAGNVAELTFLRYQEAFDKKFPIFKQAFKKVFYSPLKLLQTPIETALNYTGNFEGAANKEARMHQSREERLDGLLDVAYHYSTALAVGYTALVGTERGLSKVLKTDHVPTGVWWGVDAPVHLGIIALMGAPAMKNQTEGIKSTCKSIMQAAGWSPEKAEQDARLATFYILPNYATWAVTSAAMAGRYYYHSKGVMDVAEGAIKNISDIAKHLGIGGSRSLHP